MHQWHHKLQTFFTSQPSFDSLLDGLHTLVHQTLKGLIWRATSKVYPKKWICRTHIHCKTMQHLLQPIPWVDSQTSSKHPTLGRKWSCSCQIMPKNHFWHLLPNQTPPPPHLPAIGSPESKNLKSKMSGSCHWFYKWRPSTNKHSTRTTFINCVGHYSVKIKLIQVEKCTYEY